MSITNNCLCLGCLNGKPRKWCILLLKDAEGNYGRYYYEFFSDGIIKKGLYREISNDIIDLTQDWEECSDNAVSWTPIENNQTTLYVPGSECFVYGYCDKHN